MRTLDFAPLYRATVGFDRIADLMDRVLTTDVAQPTYPPYNIEKTAEDAYRISIAVAGFAPEELSVDSRLSVRADSMAPIVCVALSDFSISMAARVSSMEAKASPEVARRWVMLSPALASSSFSCSWAPEMDERMRSAWLTMASRSEPSSCTSVRTRISLSE